MEELSEFIYTTIESKKPTLKELLALVVEKFQSNLAVSDVSLIKRKYSEIILSLWERECEETLNEIFSDGEISGDKIVEMINILESEDIHKVKSILNNKSLELIESETDQVNFHFSCKKILNILKRKVKLLNESIRREYEFFEALIELLRHSFPYYDEFVDEILMLNDFVSKEISLHDITEKVGKFIHENEYFNKLKDKTVNFPNDSSFLEYYIRKEIENYIAKIEVNSYNEIVEIKKKVMTSSDIIDNYKDENEIHVICDILHINDDLPERFRGKNIAICANHIHIHKASKWNLSGEDGKSAYSSNAGQTSGKGNDGGDGFAGESGGNICVECKSITNASDWKIISNGGNGSDGQNGGDGKDGKDGKDASTDDLKIDGKEIYISFFNYTKLPKDCNVTVGTGYFCAHKQYQEDGLVKELYFRKTNRVNEFMLFFVKGSDGESGKRGGLAGRGGEGGFCGEILIKTTDNVSGENVEKGTNNRGNNGKNGTAGFNGLNGRDGRDLGCYDSYYTAKRIIGDDGYYKYEIKLTQINDHGHVWDEGKQAYAYMSHKSTISTVQSHRQRNQTNTDKALELQAKAAKKSPILMQNIKSKNSSYLNTSNESIKSMANKYGCVSTNITTDNCTTSIANVRVVYQVHYDKNEMIINNSVVVKVQNFKLTEIIRMIKQGIPATELIEILERNELSIKDLKAFKRLLNADKSIFESKSSNQIVNEEIFSKAVRKFKNSKKNIVPNIFGNTENLDSEFINYLAQNEPFFVYNFFKIFTQEKFSREDIKIMINEKLRLRQFENAFTPFFDGEFVEKCKVPIDAKRIIPYLSESDEFKNDFRDFFIKNSDENKDVVRKVFARFISLIKTATKDEKIQLIHCLTSMFYFLLYHQDELPEIKDILVSYRQAFEKKIKIKITTKGIDIEEKKLKDGFEIIAEFFTIREIQTFITENITKYGSYSPIYRKLIAYEFGVNIKIFVRNIQQSFFQIENHNENTVEQTFLLMSNEKFTELRINIEKYRIFYKMEKITINCVNKFSNLQESDNLTMPSYNLTESDKFTFANLFDTEKCWINEDNLIELILSKFDANEDELDELRSYLKCITELSILTAINVRFYNEPIALNVKELSIIIMTIVSLISQHEYLIKYFTFLLLANSNSKWLAELILLSIERKIYTVSQVNKKLWRKTLNDVQHKEILFLLLNKIEATGDNMSGEDFCKIIEFLKYFTMTNYQHLLKVELKSWQYEITTEYWVNQFKSIMPHVNEDDLQLKEILNKLQSKYSKNILKQFIEILGSKKSQLEKFNIKEFLTKFITDEWIFNDEIMDILKQNDIYDWMTKLTTQYYVDKDQRSVSQIVHLIEVNSETSPFIHNSMDKILNQTNQVLQKSAFFMDLYQKRAEEGDVFCINDCFKDWIKKFNSDEHKFDLIETMAHIVIAFQYKSKNNVMLRHTQIISILTLWNNDKNMKGTLIQIGTGEGKTFVAIALAILKVLNGQNVDIITSSSVLAERDANNEENRKIFETFGLKVDHNCYEDAEKRKAAYKNSNVIYGILNNFQRDYLLTEFHGQNLLSNHHFKNVIVDEVDSMLLDKGNNILYLSQDLPDIDEIESVFTFIWQWINQTTDDRNEMLEILRTSNVRKILLDNSYGLIEEALIYRILPAAESSVDCKKLMWNLQSNKIIDDEGVIILENFDDCIIQSALKGYCSQEVVNKIKFLIKEKIESEKQVKIPKYLKNFVMLHLNKWIENAVRALLMENNNQFTIDRDRSGTMSNFDPSVIIVDLDTGTDQTNSQWDEGLHQFLQLKYGCKLSLTSLKSVFISNVSYFKMYECLYGLSGTLGALQERKKLKEIYDLNFVTIPSYLPKRFFEAESIMTRNSEDWLEEIKKEVLDIFEKNRSVLIICETIKNLEIIKNKIKDIKNVYVYQRDYEKFNIDVLHTKTLILATNLAGRGTDIVLSPDLKLSGGLHVILTYLAANLRVENQAFGRASRAGDDGTGRLIICSSSDEHISLQKQVRDQNELVRLENISAYYKNFISVEEEFFEKFRHAFKNYSSLLDEKLQGFILIKFLLNEPSQVTSYFTRTAGIITNSMKNESEEMKEILLEDFKIKWAFWLDENSVLLEQWENVQNQSLILSSFENFVSKYDHVNYENVEFYPVSRLKVFKWFVKYKRLEEAKKVLYKDFQFDSIAYNYYDICIDLMINQKNNNYEHRDLNEDEEKSLKICLNNFNHRDNLRSAQNYTVNALKEKFRNTLIPIEAYKKQQISIAEFERIFMNNIQELLGKSVTPQTFHSTLVSNELIKNKVYDNLANKGFISGIEISRVLIDKNLEKIARNYQISTVELKYFLQKVKDTSFSSFDDFSEELKSYIKFPSRELFWENLLKSKILTNEEEFAVIDLMAMKNIDPSELERLIKIFKDSKLNALPVDKITQVYMDSINEDNEALKDQNNKIAVKLKILQTSLSDNNKFKHFVKHDCIKIHKRANFDLKKYKNSKLSDFDQISVNDFKTIIADPTDIVKSLYEQKILDENLQLNYENLKDLDLGENFVYESQICDLISRKFAFRKALEIFAMKIIENIESESLIKNEIIHLHSQPHFLIIHDLIENLIIDARKVNSSRVDEIKDLPIFKKFLLTKEISEILIEGNIDRDLELITELKDKNLIDDKETYIKKKIINKEFERGLFVISNFNVNDENLSENYKNIEKTIRLLLQNQRIIVENKNDLINRIKQSVMPLRDNTFERPQFVFKSIEDVCNQDDIETLNFMKLKGLDLIIKIQEKKWTRTYFIRLTVVMMAGAIQIAIGVIITILLSGIGAKIGQSFISEGIGDIIFAMSTLKSGHFRWSDYGRHKKASVFTTVLMFGVTAALSKFNMFKNYFAISSSKFGDIIAGRGFSNMSGWELLKQSNIIVEAAKKEMWKAFYKDVTINSIKAISIAGVSMGVDKFVEQQLGMITLSISSYIVDEIKSDFNTHEVTKTIDKLLQFYTIKKAENIIDTKFRKILDEHYGQMSSDVGDKIDQIIQSGNGINKIVTTFSTITAKTVAIGSMMLFISNVLDEFNSELKNQIQSTPQEQIVCKPSDDEITQFNLKVSEDIQKQLAEQMKTVVNRNIVSPALKYAANYALNKAASASVNFYKSIRKSKDEAKFIEETINTIDTLNKLNKKESLTEAEKQEKQYLENRAMEILSSTTNHLVYAQLSRLDIPMTHIGVEGAAILISSKLNKNLKIVIVHEGIEHSFGEGNEVIKIDLKDYHFANSKLSFNNDCLFNALAEKLPDLKEHFDSQSLRDGIAVTMITDDNMKAYIADTRKKFFHDIGFYGGNPIALDQKSKDMIKKWETVSNYVSGGKVGVLKKLHSQRKDVVEIDHMPQKAAYKNTKYELISENNMPGIALNYPIHRSLTSTGNFKRQNECTQYKDMMHDYLSNGEFDKAVLHSIIDLHHNTVLFVNDRTNQPDQFKIDQNIFFKDYLKEIDKYLAYCAKPQFPLKGIDGNKVENQPLLTKEQVTKIKIFAETIFNPDKK